MLILSFCCIFRFVLSISIISIPWIFIVILSSWNIFIVFRSIIVSGSIIVFSLLSKVSWRRIILLLLFIMLIRLFILVIVSFKLVFDVVDEFVFGYFFVAVLNIIFLIIIFLFTSFNLLISWRTSHSLDVGRICTDDIVFYLLNIVLSGRVNNRIFSAILSIKLI